MVADGVKVAFQIHLLRVSVRFSLGSQSLASIHRMLAALKLAIPMALVFAGGSSSLSSSSIAHAHVRAISLVGALPPLAGGSCARRLDPPALLGGSPAVDQLSADLRPLHRPRVSPSTELGRSPTRAAVSALTVDSPIQRTFPSAGVAPFTEPGAPVPAPSAESLPWACQLPPSQPVARYGGGLALSLPLRERGRSRCGSLSASAPCPPPPRHRP